MLPVALCIAVLALIAVFRGGWGAGPASIGPPPMGEIDDASRARLERVLQDAEIEDTAR
ncbi:MAG: hypothetical protein ACE5FL_05365 [Myxococcota bacterium]